MDPSLILGSVTIMFVGQEQKQYAVHKQLLCNKLGYFRSAYRTKMREATEDVFRLEDVTPAAFECLIAWLYTGLIYIDPSGGSKPLPTGLVPEEPNGDDEYIPPPASGSGDDKSIKSDDTAEPAVNDMDDFVASALRYEEIKGGARSPTNASIEASTNPGNLLADHTFPGCKASELDAYQLQVLIALHGSRTDSQIVDRVLQWQQTLEEKLGGDREEAMDGMKHGETGDDGETDVFDRLVELFVLADRFDSPELRAKLPNAFDQEIAVRKDFTGGRGLPTFETVTRAYENTPESSWLRAWLVRVYSSIWAPRCDSPDQVSARRQLPFDFLLDVAVCMAHHAEFSADDMADDAEDVEML
ncbi:unnamed protein product [Zymoseptoria tritici ST99CH_1A5]|uniref:BTB domain-containing protein n=1 Tax=Zymoseptoria tritici ST99CH_1A5 TaxID=1276529 RepID=A0A1Y6LLS9_ZYMTR|nr:unnamed protein product [Zymoseptoria tritici ST99CH_1A5]